MVFSVQEFLLAGSMFVVEMHFKAWVKPAPVQL